MTNEEELELEERLCTARAIKLEISSLQHFIDCGQYDDSIHVNVMVKSRSGPYNGPGSWTEVNNLSEGTRREINSAVIVALKNRLVELEKEYESL